MYLCLYKLLSTSLFMCTGLLKPIVKESLMCRHFTNYALLSETHRMLQKTCKDFADNELQPVASQLDKACQYPREQVGYL